MNNLLGLLQEAISWREVNDADLTICEAGPPKASGKEASFERNEAIFVRNAIRKLFRHAYAEKNDQEIVNFAALIDDHMSRDSYNCLVYGKEFQKILAYLQRRGELGQARQLLEKHLSSLGVLDRKGDTMSVGRFVANYSYSWPVIFFDTYTKLLIKQGETAMAKALLAQALNTGKLLDDAAVMLRKTLEALDGKKVPSKFSTIFVRKADLDPRYLAEPSTERVALAYLRKKLHREGVVADVDLWRLIPTLVRGEMSPAHLATTYASIVGVQPPKSFYDSLIANRDVFAAAFEASFSATFGAVGFPDLILYDEHHFRDLLFVEVKDVNDRMRPHQEAILNAFVELGMACQVLKFTQ